MATYAIGDVQGCFAALRSLLQKIDFDPARDRLWFTGDLVNRGPQSLAVLRFVRGLGERAVTVLGNHDLHLLAVAAGTSKYKEHDTFKDVLQADDRDELLAWLIARPLLHQDATLGYAMVHAGLLPQWDLARALELARETGDVLCGPQGQNFFAHMYGDLPDHWSDGLTGIERVRVIVNACTRLRYCDREGNMDLRYKGAPGTQPPDLMPWFRVPARRSAQQRIIFGHWSALGLFQADGVLGLDSGCFWGRHLTAARLDAAQPSFFSVACAAA
jgi:bis(5'-nucleosyl)-tetraphosphatase (symmetrical)